MACARPIETWLDGSGRMTMNRAKAEGPMFLKDCGKCMPCRVRRRQELTLRLIGERREHREGAFVTLTYDADHLPSGGTLVKRDLQLFMKRVRSRYCDRKVRFYGCGEYGEGNLRPHYHVLLFGLDFDDGYAWRQSSGGTSYRSAELEKLWKLGSSEFGEVEDRSCAYVAGYVTKKITGKKAKAHYQVVDGDGVVYDRLPEFHTSSLSLGLAHFQRYMREMVDNGSCIMKGREVPLPEYYRRKLKDVSALDADWLAYEQAMKGEVAAAMCAADLTPERRLVREQVLIANMRRFHKPLD